MRNFKGSIFSAIMSFRKIIADYMFLKRIVASVFGFVFFFYFRMKTKKKAKLNTVAIIGFKNI